jgi:hypothetical protein
LKWTGRGGLKKKNDKKECKNGITSCKVDNEKGFVIACLLKTENLKKFQKNKNEPFGIPCSNTWIAKYLKVTTPLSLMLALLEVHKMQNICQEGRQYIISCSQSRVYDIFTKYFIKSCNFTRLMCCMEMICMCLFLQWGIGEGSNKKMVKEKKEISIETSSFINSYNKGHGFIDTFKARIVSVRESRSSSLFGEIVESCITIENIKLK